ncbi:MAG: hypothetical protein JXD18_06860 [Anaerolineae bacterium]|nr:hypothetical protein [Anaerolineae bacterium]
MTAPVMLIPLKCVRCGTPVPARPGEVAWRCAQCGQGLLLDEVQGVRPLEIHFAAGVAPGVPRRPFWVADGQAALQRVTYSSFGKQTEAAQQFWSAPRRFFVPAFEGTLDALLDVGAGLLQRPVALQEGDPVEFAPVVLLPRDIAALAEFIVVAIEAERKDKIKQVDFALQLSEAALWIL